MKGRIVISGLLGKDVNLVDVISQVAKQPTATEFDVLINSEGGDVDTGWHIHDYLIGLKKPLTTIGQGVVASMATVLFMAGTVRKVYDNTLFMVHLPRVTGFEGTAEEIRTMSKEMDKVENRMVEFYSNNFSIDKDTIKTLLRNETFLTRKQLEDLGITTATPIRAVAQASFNTRKPKINKMKRKMNNKQKGLLNQIKAMLSGSVEAKLLYSAEGRELDFPALDEDTAVSVGDVATYTDDGSLPDGEVVMQDGRIFVFEEGVVMEIRDEDEESDIEELQERIEELEEANAQLTARLDRTQKDALNKRAILAKLTQIESAFDIDPIEKPGRQAKKESRFKTALNNVKKK